MDTLMTEEEKMLQTTAREFLEAECPIRLVRDMETDDKGFPPDLWKNIADLGWLGLPGSSWRRWDAPLPRCLSIAPWLPG
jgi:alkylation response protein AidB-like acyl-CoA dehydrogenase